MDLAVVRCSPYVFGNSALCLQYVSGHFVWCLVYDVGYSLLYFLNAFVFVCCALYMFLLCLKCFLCGFCDSVWCFASVFDHFGATGGHPGSIRGDMGSIRGHPGASGAIQGATGRGPGEHQGAIRAAMAVGGVLSNSWTRKGYTRPSRIYE